MGIDRPGAIGPHPRLSPKGWSGAEDGRPESFCLARGMPSAGVPALRTGWPGRGKSRAAAVAGGRSRRSRSSARFAHPGPAGGAPGTRQGDWRQRAATGRGTGVTDGEDFPWRANKVSRISAGRCKPSSCRRGDEQRSGTGRTRTDGCRCYRTSDRLIPGAQACEQATSGGAAIDRAAP